MPIAISIRQLHRLLDTMAVNRYEGLEKSPDRCAWKKVSDLIRGVRGLRNIGKACFISDIGSSGN